MFKIDYQQKTTQITEWIRNTLNAAGFRKLLIGLSGGIDSAVTAALAIQAVGVENVTVVLLPYGELGNRAVIDAGLVAKNLQIHGTQIITTNIKPAVDAIVTQSEKLDNIRKGNIMARMRMIYLFDMAKKYGSLVCGTENKTEHLLGYYTRFGDGASDMEPIRNLYKTQVFQIANLLKIPPLIISKEPTADLWKDQTDEKEFGFTYQDADKVLYYRFEKNFTENEILTKGISSEIIKRVLAQVEKNKFKRYLPYIFSS